MLQLVLLFGQADLRIILDGEFVLEAVFSFGDDRLVATRRHLRSCEPTEAESLSLGHLWILHGVVPADRIDPFVLTRTNGRHLISIHVLDLHAHLAESVALGQYVFDLCACAWISTVPFGLIAGTRSKTTTALLHDKRLAFKKMELLTQYFPVDLPKWGHIIDNDDAPTMRAEHKVVGFGVHLQMMDGHGWNILIVTTPAASTVQGNVETKLCSQEKKVLIHQIFLNAPSENGHVIADDAGPCLPEIRGLVGVRLLIATGVGVEDRVGRPRTVHAGFNVIHPGVFGKPFDIGRGVLP